MLKKNAHWLEKPNNFNRIILSENSKYNSIFKSSEQYESVTECSNPEYTATDTLVQAESMVCRGIKLEQENNFAEAIDCYRQAVKLNTQSAIAHHILAIALKKQNKLTEANFHHQQALSLGKNSTDRPDRLNLDNFDPKIDSKVEQHSENQLESKTNSHKFNGIFFLPKLTAIAPGTYVENTKLEVAKIFLQQAKLYFAEHRWQKTIDACEDALKMCPEIAEIYKVYGNSLQKLGQTAEAIGFYAKALAVDSDFAEVYANIGNIYAQQEQWKEAIDYYQKALKVNPKLGRVYIYLSKVWEKKGEPENAINCLLQGLKCDPKIFTLQQYLQFADELLAEGKVNFAITCYEYAVKLDPSCQELYQKIVSILEQNGEWQKAASYYKDIIRIRKTSNEDSNFNKEVEKKQIIESLFKDTSNNITKQQYLSPTKNLNNSLSNNSTAIAKNPERLDFAINHLITKLQQEPNSPDIRLRLGNLFVQKQKWKQAIICYRQAIKLEPSLAIAYIKLGKIYGILGKNIDAAKLIFKGYSLQPKEISPEKHYTLGNYFLKHQEDHLAISCYRRAIDLKPGFSEARNQLQKIMNIRVNKQALIEPDNSQNLESNMLSLQSTEEENNITKQQDQSIVVVSDRHLEPKLEVTKGKLFLEMGIAAEKEANWNLAYKCYKQSIEQEPTNWSAYHHAGTVLKTQQKWLKASEYYLQSVEINQKNFSSYYHLGETYLELVEWQKAANVFKQSIVLKSNFSWSHYKLGLALIELKLWQEAADAINRSVNLNPNFDWAHHKLGDVYTHQRNWDKAVEAFRNALEITPDLPKTKEKLIEVLRQRYKSDRTQVEVFYSNAVELEPNQESSYFKALEVKPESIEHYIQLAQIYEAKGKKNVALSFYRIALQIDPQHSEVNAKLKALQS